MKKNYIKMILSFVLFVFTMNVYSQTNNYWTEISKDKASAGELHFRKTEPIKAMFYSLNLNELKSALANAPKREVVGNNSGLILKFPNSNGKIENYRIVEASIMEQGLQEQYPNFKSYAGQSVANPEGLIRFSITDKGLHSMSHSSATGTNYIDAYAKNSNTYIVYAKSDLLALENGFSCLYENTEEDNERLLDVNESSLFANDGLLRNFRIAVATTIEYSQFHWMAAGIPVGGTEAAKRTAVMDAVVVTMTRNNFIYERDLSITMTLVANNNSIIFINSDNFDNDNAGTLINQSQTVIDGAIGFGNYDIGHTFSTGGGGLAALGSPCTGNKARGITGLPNPVGDPYDVDFVAHELGHQYGSPHTFNGSTANCAGGNRSGSNAYEVGSGSTIMAYAGICAPQNVQPNSDAYFHQRSLFLIFTNVTSQNSTCAATTATGNAAPTSEAGTNFTVPISTPYKLTGSSTDVDGTGTHTYTWEQYDLGPAGIPEATNTNGPMVRSVTGTNNPSRFIPGLEDLLGSNGGSTQWEVLPSVARTQNFRMTVRDNDVRGGQTAVDNMSVSFNASAGPFRVTSQNTNQIVWTAGNTETVTWDVANTNTGAASSANVNILLSTDGGLTYPTVLATNVANDGSHDITVPNVTAPRCRIMVEAASNIFFNINSQFIAIGNYTYVPQPETCTDYPFNAGIPVVENGASYTGYTLSIPDSQIISDVNINVNITSANNADLWYAIRAPWQPAGLQQLASGICAGTMNTDITFDDEGVAVNCANTNTGQNYIPQVALSFADGQDSQGDWVFFLTDIVVDGTISTWNSTTITICKQEVLPILATETFNLEDSFTLYPNPNNGTFTLDLKTLNSNSVSVSVSDIRGRRIFNENYKASGSLKETIDLGRVQSGIYLVNIKDGNNQVTKKIVVE